MKTPPLLSRLIGRLGFGKNRAPAASNKSKTLPTPPVKVPGNNVSEPPKSPRVKSVFDTKSGKWLEGKEAVEHLASKGITNPRAQGDEAARIAEHLNAQHIPHAPELPASPKLQGTQAQETHHPAPTLGKFVAAGVGLASAINQGESDMGFPEMQQSQLPFQLPETPPPMLPGDDWVKTVFTHWMS